MPYTDSLLASGERMLRRSRQHPLMLARRARWAILALALALGGLAAKLVTGGTGPIFGFLGWLTLVMFVAGGAWFVLGILRYRNEEFLVTSRRVVHIEGVANKRVVDASLEKISDAVLTESALGRLLGYGDLSLLTASEGGIERLRMLSGAKAFKLAILESRHDLELELSRTVSPPIRSGEHAGPPGGTAGPAGTSAPARAATETGHADLTGTLERLRELRDRGAITPSEYEAKKAELLARL